MVDDSIVRGNTTKMINVMLRNAGAKEVHIRISSPPYKFLVHGFILLQQTSWWHQVFKGRDQESHRSRHLRPSLEGIKKTR